MSFADPSLQGRGTAGRPCLAMTSLACATWLVARSFAADLPAGTAKPDLTTLSLEELGQIRVTSVSKKEELLAHAPAAIHVITQDDLRRSGVTSIPEALRMVPGLQVARQDAHTWAISSRGFNNTFANKLLVLVDGRSVYTPLFSGVYWDVQDTMLEDIERIEVIRGPGSALWGANAVNGVINITTKRARDTTGTLVTVGGGTEDHGLLGVRHGLKLADAVFLRLYGKGFVNDHSARFGGGDANDEWRQARGGFRLDWEPSDANQMTVQGDVYGGGFHQTLTEPVLAAPFTTTAEQTGRVAGGNALFRWTRQFAEESDLRFQAYYDRTTRDVTYFGETREALDVELQHRLPVGERHSLTWGLNYRLMRDDAFKQSSLVTLNPASADRQLGSLFLQDQIELVPEQLKLTLGAKVEHNDYTGWSLQPNARLMWSPLPEHHLWAAVSRAVRTPSRAERDARVSISASAGPTLVSYFGSREFGDERVMAYEIGHRWQPRPRLSFDSALFYNQYSHLSSVETGTAFPEVTPAPAHFTVPLIQSNQGAGETYGGELTGRWQAADWWRLTASYACVIAQMHRQPGSTDTYLVTVEGSSPRNQLSLRSAWDLPEGFSVDATVRYVDNLRSFQVPAYLTMDLRLAWCPRPNVEFAIVGQNLLDRAHPEFFPQTLNTERTEVERAVYGKVTYKF